jgi:hypothetical protein
VGLLVILPKPPFFVWNGVSWCSPGWSQTTLLKWASCFGLLSSSGYKCGPPSLPPKAPCWLLCALVLGPWKFSHLPWPSTILVHSTLGWVKAPFCSMCHSDVTNIVGNTDCFKKWYVLPVVWSLIVVIKHGFWFFCGTGVWTQGLHPDPLQQSFFVMGFFEIGSPRTICLGWLRTTILISASWVARITNVSHRCPARWQCFGFFF